MQDRAYRIGDAAFRWAFRRSYGHAPRKGELERYVFWHTISRRREIPRHQLSSDEIAGLELVGDPGPWENWPARPVPDLTRTSRAAAQAITELVEAVLGPESSLSLESATVPTAPAPMAAATARHNRPYRHGRVGIGARARTLVREQLANGPKPESQIAAAAAAAEIPERALIAAADALGVRCRRGEWWLPG